MARSKMINELSPDEAAAQLHAMQSRPLGFATIDHHRAERCGAAEVIFAAGKTAGQVILTLTSGQ